MIMAREHMPSLRVGIYNPREAFWFSTSSLHGVAEGVNGSEEEWSTDQMDCCALSSLKLLKCPWICSHLGSGEIFPISTC